MCENFDILKPRQYLSRFKRQQDPAAKFTAAATTGEVQPSPKQRRQSIRIGDSSSTNQSQHKQVAAKIREGAAR